MKHMLKNSFIVMVVLASLLIVFIGCSDMMVKMGEILLTIEAEDTIRTSVKEYTVTGNLKGSKSIIKLEQVKPKDTITIPNISSGTWVFSIVAFDHDNNQIGTGIKEIYLAEGKKADLRIPVVFDPLPLVITGTTLPGLTKVYDGTTTLAVDLGSLSGIVVGDEKIKVEATATYNDKNVGTDKAITVSYTLIYTDDSAITDKYSAPDPYVLSTKGVITEKPLSISEPLFPASKDKLYDANTILSVTAGSLIGIVEGDEVSVKAIAAYADKNAGNDKTITVTYELEGPHAANYLAPADYTTKGNVTKKAVSAVTGTELEPTKIYDGSTSSRIKNIGSLDGFIKGDTVMLEANAFYNDRKVGTSKNISVEYYFTGLDAANYEEPSANTTDHQGTITKRPLTTAGTSLTISKVYDKNRTAKVTIDAEKEIGIVIGDDIELIPEAYYRNTIAGPSLITVSYTLAGKDSENYSKPADDPINFGVITPKQLNIDNPSFPDSTSKEYDGNNFLSVTAGSLNNVVDGGDEVTVVAAATYAGKGAGNNKEIIVTYVLSGKEKENYYAPKSYWTETGEITRKSLTVHTGSTLIETTKTYDGSSSSKVITPGTLDGLISTSEDVVLEAEALYADKDVGNDKIITVSYSLTGPDAANYVVPSPTTSSMGTIIKKALSVQAGTTQIRTEKHFDTTFDAEILAAGTLVGVLEHEDVVLEASASYDDATINSNKPITVVYSLRGSDAANYTNPVNDTSCIGRIGNGKLTISDPVLVKTKIYNSSQDCIVFPGNTIQGVMESDSVQVQATATYDTKNVGTKKQIRVVYSLTGKDAEKYIAPDTYIVTDGEIQHKQLSITSPSVANISKPYDGNTNVEFIPGAVSGIYGSDNVSVVSNGFYVSDTIGNDKRIFFTYTLEGSDTSNYFCPAYEVLYSASIIKRPLSVQSDTTEVVTEKVYDSSSSTAVIAPGFLTGFIGTEEVTLSATASFLDSGVGTDKNIIVTYMLGGKDADKYQKPEDKTIIGAIKAKPLSITATAVSKIYDAKTNTTGSLAFGDSEILGSDVVSATGTFTFADVDVGLNKTVSVTGIKLLGAQASNYTVAPTTATTATIDEAVLTAKVSDTFKTYGNENPTVAVTVSGFVHNETADTADAYVAPSISLVATALSNVGDYEITITGGSATNYRFDTTDTATLTIKKAVLTATVADVSRTYGMANPTVAVTVSGFANGETADTPGIGYVAPVASSSAIASSNAGTSHTISITGGSADNYSFDTTNTAVLTIDKATHNMSGIAFADKAVTYTGEPHSLEIGGALPTAVTPSYSNNAQTDAGNHTVVVSFEYDTTNYNVIDPMTAILTINKAVLKATVEDASKIYGDENPTFAVTVSGFVHNENADTADSYEAPSSFHNATVLSSVGDYEISMTGGSATNYSFDITDTATLTIDKATHTMGGLTLADKAVTYTGGSHSLVIDGTLPIGVTPSYSNNAQTNAGNHTVVVSFEYDTTNYNVIDSMTAILTINKAVLKATVEDASKIHGDANPAFAITMTGFVHGENVGTPNIGYVAPIAATTAIETSDVGEYTITITGGEATNYSFDISDTAVFTIEFRKIQLDIKGPKMTGSRQKEYDGTTSFLFVPGDLIGVIPGDDVAVTAIANYDTKNVSTDKVISVAYTLEGLEKDKYIAPVSGVFDTLGWITEKTLTATVDDAFRTYGESNPVFPVTVTGFIDGETAETLGSGYVPPIASSDATESTGAGTADIIITGGSATNYRFSYVPKTLTINKKELTVTVGSVASKTYDGSAVTTGVLNLTGILHSDDVRATGVFVFDDKNVGSGKTVNITSIELTGAQKDNYSLRTTGATATAAINKAVLTATVEDVSRPYGEANPVFPVIVTGFANGETAETPGSGYVAPSASSNATTSSNAGTTHAITITGGSATNYSFTLVPGILTISKATYNMDGITFDDKTVTYDGKEHPLEIGGSSLPDGVSVRYNNNIQRKVRESGHTVNAIFTGSSNYAAIPSKSAVLTIQPKPLTVIANADDKVYNQQTRARGTLSHNPEEVIAGDYIRMSDNSIFTFSDANVGSDKTVTVSNVKIWGGDASNYTYIEPVITTATITKATYHWGWVHYNSLVYNGQPQGPNITGLPAGVTFTYSNKDMVNYGEYTTDITFYGDYDNYEAIPNEVGKYVYINRKPISIKKVTFDDKVFDESMTATGTIELEGVVGDDEVLPGFQSEGFKFKKQQASDEPQPIYVWVQSYNLGGAQGYNYTYVRDTPTYFEGLAKINKKQLTVKATVGDKYYTGDTGVWGPKLDLVGLVSDRNAPTVEGTFAFEDADAGENKRVNVTGITISGYNSSNYYLESDSTTTTGTILKSTYPTNWYVVDYSYRYATYDGESHQAALKVKDGYTIPNGVSITYNDSSNQINAGNYVVTASFHGDEINYEAMDPVTLDLSISPMRLTPKPVALDKVYDGTTEASGSISLVRGSDEGLGPVEGDDVGATGNFEFNIPDASSSVYVYVRNIALTGDSAGNYTLNDTNSNTHAEISKATHDMSGVAFNDTTVTYDGEAHPLVISGLLPDGVTINRYYYEESVHAGKHAAHAYFKYDEDNFNTLEHMTATLTIEQRPLTITGVTVSSKVYDGETETYGQFTFEGDVSSDNIWLRGTFNFNDPNAGDDKRVNVTNIYASANHNYSTDYALPIEYTATGTINKATLSIRSYELQDKTLVYDREVHSLAIRNEMYLPKGVTVSYVNNGQISAGNHEVTANFIYDPNNWNPIASQTKRLTIEKKLLSVTAHVDDKVYDGTTDFTTSLSLEGVIGSEVVSVTGNFNFYSSSANAGINKQGSLYEYSLEGINAANYRLTGFSVPYTHNVYKAVFNPPADFYIDKELVYDGNTHSLEHGVLPVGLTISYTDFHEERDVGTYHTTINFSQDNYEQIDPLSATLTIKPKELTVAVSVDTKPYDGSTSATGTLTFGGKVKDYHSVTSTANIFTFDTSEVGSNKEVTVTEIQLSGYDSENYSLPSRVTGLGKIEKAVMSGSVGITGEHERGALLTADVTGLTNCSDTATFQWMRDGVPLDGAVNATYTLVSQDHDTSITVVVEADEVSYTGKLTSAAIIPSLWRAYIPPATEAQEGGSVVTLSGFGDYENSDLSFSIKYDNDERTYYLPLNSLDGHGRLRYHIGKSHTVTAAKSRIMMKIEGENKGILLLEEKPLEVGDYFRGGIVAYLGNFAAGGIPYKGLVVSEDTVYKEWIKPLGNAATLIGLWEDAFKVLGKGKSNTADILRFAAKYKYKTSLYAASYADNYKVQEYDDWFLPSIDELDSMRGNIEAIGGFNWNDSYWSSTEEPQKEGGLPQQSLSSVLYGTLYNRTYHGHANGVRPMSYF